MIWAICSLLYELWFANWKSVIICWDYSQVILPTTKRMVTEINADPFGWSILHNYSFILSLCVYYIRLWSTSTVGVLCVMAAAVLRSRLPDWEFGQIFGSASVCVFDLWGVATHFNSIFTSFLIENNRVNGFAWLTFF